MIVRIDREREDRKIATGWFSRTRIPVYCLFLTVHLEEEERFLLKQSGIGHYILFRGPIPPDITDPDKIKTHKAENFGLFIVSDLLRFGSKTLIGAWPDVIAADAGELALRAKLDEISKQLARAGGTTETSAAYEL